LPPVAVDPSITRSRVENRARHQVHSSRRQVVEPSGSGRVHNTRLPVAWQTGQIIRRTVSSSWLLLL
jgi:hypothetical protein